MVKESRFLDRQYTVFGEVVSGLDVADQIVVQERDGRDNPKERIEIKVRVIEAEIDSPEVEEKQS